MLKKLVLMTIAICFVNGASYSKIVKEDFEKGNLKAWEIEGDAKIDSDQKHAGSKALKVPPGSKAVWNVEKDNKFGKATIWVYDSLAGSKVPTNTKGPRWGVVNADGDSFVIGILEARPESPISWGNYYWNSSANNFAWWHAQLPGRTKGWNKFSFNLPDAKTLDVTMDDDKQAKIDETKSQFAVGFVGVILGGGSEADNPESFYFDDIEISLK